MGTPSGNPDAPRKNRKGDPIMEGITPDALWTLILTAALAITTLAGAVEKIVNAVKVARTPHQKQDARLDALEAWRREVDGKLNRDNDRLESMDEGSRVTQRAILALLDHGIDGNNIEQMQHAKEALQNHLIDK